MPWRLKSVLVTILVATTVALGVRLLFVENYRIVSDSMAPGLADGDVVMISKLSFNIHLPFSSYEVVRLRRPRPGEVVMFTVPDHGLDTFVKRVVASEGDRVAIQNGVLFVNNQAARYEPVDQAAAVFRERLPDSTSYRVKWDRTRIENYGPVDIPPGYFFVLGDNRLDVTDSRTWGPIPLACLKGRLAMVWYSKAQDHQKSVHEASHG